MLPESFALALKSIDKTAFGLWPRFTYLIGAAPASDSTFGNADQGIVGLVHSFHSQGVPFDFDGDFCRWVNQILEPRIVFQRTEDSPYELLMNKQDCENEIGPYEPRLCGELSGLPWGVVGEVFKEPAHDRRSKR